MSVKITVNPNGSLKVEGAESVELVDATGKAFNLQGRSVVGLCRCGASANKPFCDGAHRACNFQSEIIAFDLPPKKA